MKFFHNLSIKSKLILIIISVTAITIGIGFTVTIIYNNYIYKDEMIENISINAQLLGEYCIVPLTFEDEKVAKTILEKIRTIPSILTACVYDEHKNLFASYHKTSDNILPDSVPNRAKSVFTKHHFELFQPVIYQDARLGTIYIKASTEFLNAKINQHLLVILLLVLGLIILSYFIALKLQSSISKPIMELTKTTEIITEEANYSIRVRKKGYDEIGKLYDSFNKMISQINLREKERDTAEELLRKSEREIKMLNHGLEERVKQRTSQLLAANKELEAFAYSVSHDLRTPLRSISSFSQILLEEHRDILDDQGRDYLNRVYKGAQRMSQLIDDLLKLSKITRSDMNIQEVNLSNLVNSIASELQKIEADRKVSFKIQKKIIINADERLIQIAIENLMENAWKFTSLRPSAIIEFGMQQNEENNIYFVRDNGAGFNMKYHHKLFGAFQRLHSIYDFPGTGIGLATVQRVIQRHGGKIWAEGEVDKGATFYFTLT